jgi:hypothetical protein
MNIIVRMTTQFGVNVIIPVCPTAVKLAELSGNKTMTVKAIAVIKALGYTVNVEQTLPLTL